MNHPTNLFRIKSSVVFTIVFLLAASVCMAQETSFKLDNGMQVILKENHNSPMVASVIFIKSGSKYESRFENGATHFLEHLLFDGTANQTREELDASIRDLGGYLNAFTRKETTAYLVLVPKQFIDYGMNVQADMLFNSVFPDEELPKERQVVIEEIRQSADQPGAAADAFFTQKAMANTPYARSVLGHEPFINNIPRSAIIDYWKNYYTPENMITLVIGDFDSENMAERVKAVFERYPGGETATESDSNQAADGDWIDGQYVYDTVANVSSTYLNFSIKAPRYDNPDYAAVDLLAQYLSLDEVSPLMTALKSGADPLATSVSVSVDPYAEFSRLNISIITEKADSRHLIADSVLAILRRSSQLVADPDEIQGIKTSNKGNDIYMADKLHYYGFIIAPMIMVGGWDFIQNYTDQFEATNWDQCRSAAAKYFSDPKYVLTMVRPTEGTDSEPYSPPTMTTEEVTAHFATASYPEHELFEGHQLTFPKTDAISFELDDPAEYERLVLNNGLTVLVRSSHDSRVFAVNILGKNRSAMESEARAGITDFVNRCLEKGTSSRSAGQLASDVNRIGANITLTDNPWIPYDDRYTTRQFSFVKFETIDEYAKQGLELLTDMVVNPSFDSTGVEQVRASMMSVLGRQAGSIRDQGRNLFYKAVFENGPYAKPIMGDTQTIGAITADDLKAHHRRMYSPENMIVAISTKRPVDEVMEWIKAGLGSLEPVGLTEPSVPVPTPRAATPHIEMEKEQVQIYYGALIELIDSADAAALRIATSVLSSRLYLNLREKQGLAYSIGASVSLDRGFGWYVASIGTGSGNYQAAVEGIKGQIEALKRTPPTQEEINRARNQLWGRLMSAKLSRINQAYYLSLNEFYGRPISWDQLFLNQLGGLTPEKVQAAAKKYLNTDQVVIASVGKK